MVVALNPPTKPKEPLMDTTIVLVYCLCDDLLKWQGHRDDPQCRLSDAEVMTAALVAALFFGGNQALANRFLSEQGYIRCALSRSRFCRRLQRLEAVLAQLFALLAEGFKATTAEQLYALDSMPIAVCDNCRIGRCAIYQDKCFRGYQASKKRFFFGLKLHLLVTCGGAPVEFFLTPGSYGDVACLPCFAFDLPEGACVYADKAYTLYWLEDLLAEAGRCFSPMRKGGLKRQDPPWVRYLQAYHRKAIEMANSQIERLLPKHIHAVTAAGFETKVALFVLAASVNCLAC
jgi:hypothetical protein